MPASHLRRPVRKVRSMPPVRPDRIFRKTNARSFNFTRKGNTKDLVPLLSTKRSELFDPFDTVYTSNAQSPFGVIEPELPYHLLLKAAKGNSALNQCIDAYVVNIESYGFQLEYVG